MSGVKERPSLRDLMEAGFGDDDAVEQVALPALRSLDAVREPHRPRPKGLPALPEFPAEQPKVIFLEGPSAGKTTLGAMVLSDMEEAGVLEEGLAVGLDPGVVGLAKRLPEGALHQPRTRDVKDGVALLRRVFRTLERAPMPPPFTLIDTGAGNTSREAYLREDKTLFARLRERGFAVVSLWCWQPRTLDLALLRDFLSLGQEPSALGMVLSGAYAPDSWDVYRTLIGQRLYVEALERHGAGEFWVPPAPRRVLQRVEDRGLPLWAVRDGVIPDWRPGVAPITGDDSDAMKLWWAEVEAERKGALRSWMTYRRPEAKEKGAKA